MSIRENNIGSVAVLKKASHHLAALKSEIAMTYAQLGNQEQASAKAQQLALSKIQAIEREVKGSIQQYVKQNIDSGNTFMVNPFKRNMDNKTPVIPFNVRTDNLGCLRAKIDALEEREHGIAGS